MVNSRSGYKPKCFVVRCFWVQPRPTVTGAEVEQVLANVLPRYAGFFALLAGSGLRIGEAFGTETNRPLARLPVAPRDPFNLERSRTRAKTPAAVRVIDIPEILAAVLREYVADKSGYLFPTRKGNRPLAQRNVLRALHATGVRVGFHAFRRFRTETIRRTAVPQDIERLWLGHASATVTDWCARGLQLDKAWRTEWCERAGWAFP